MANLLTLAGRVVIGGGENLCFCWAAGRRTCKWSLSKSNIVVSILILVSRMIESYFAQMSINQISFFTKKFLLVQRTRIKHSYTNNWISTCPNDPHVSVMRWLLPLICLIILTVFKLTNRVSEKLDTCSPRIVLVMIWKYAWAGSLSPSVTRS